MSEDPDFDMEIVEEDELDELGTDGESSSEERSRSRKKDLEEDGTESRDPEKKIDQIREDRSSSSKRASVSSTKSDKGTELIEGVLWSKVDSIPSGWEFVNLGPEVSIQTGYNAPSKNFVDEGGIPLIRNRDLGSEETEIEYDGEYGEEYVIEDGDLLVSMDGEFEPHMWTGGRALLNQRVCKIEGSDRYSHVFLAYAIEKPLYLLQKSIAGTTVKHLSKTNIRSVNLPTPPLPEQRKIASVLYTVDQAIQKTEAIIEQAQRLRQGIEQDLFREGYDEHGSIDFRRTVELPSDWAFEKLSDHTAESAFGPRYDSERYAEEGNIATLRTTDLDRRGNMTTRSMPRADLDLEKFNKHLLEEGDLVISRSGAYSGITTVWEGYEIPTIPGAYMIRFRLEDSINPYFLRFYFNSSVGSKRIDRRARGSGQKNLSGTDLLNMRIPVPDREEQDKIVGVIQSIEESILSQKEYESHLNHFKKGLMQDLLSGKVRTADKAIEVLEEVEAHG